MISIITSGYIDISVLKESNGVFYIKKNHPFTGKACTFYRNGNKKQEFTLNKGIKSGTYTEYWENGEVFLKSYYFNGNEYSINIDENYFDSHSKEIEDSLRLITFSGKIKLESEKFTKNIYYLDGKKIKFEIDDIFTLTQLIYDNNNLKKQIFVYKNPKFLSNYPQLSEEIYDDNDKNGIRYDYDNKGNIISSVLLNEGKYDGPYYYYNEDGESNYNDVYLNGELMRKPKLEEN